MGVRVLMDRQIAGARNVLIGVGHGRINIYERPPPDRGRGPVHHVGVRVEDFEADDPNDPLNRDGA